MNFPHSSAAGSDHQPTNSDSDTEEDEDEIDCAEIQAIDERSEAKKRRKEESYEDDSTSEEKEEGEIKPKKKRQVSNWTGLIEKIDGDLKRRRCTICKIVDLRKKICSHIKKEHEEQFKQNLTKKRRQANEIRPSRDYSKILEFVEGDLKKSTRRCKICKIILSRTDAYDHVLTKHKEEADNLYVNDMNKSFTSINEITGTCRTCSELVYRKYFALHFCSKTEEQRSCLLCKKKYNDHDNQVQHKKKHVLINSLITNKVKVLVYNSTSEKIEVRYFDGSDHERVQDLKMLFGVRFKHKETEERCGYLGFSHFLDIERSTNLYIKDIQKKIAGTTTIEVLDVKKIFEIEETPDDISVDMNQEDEDRSGEDQGFQINLVKACKIRYIIAELEKYDFVGIPLGIYVLGEKEACMAKFAARFYMIDVKKIDLRVSHYPRESTLYFSPNGIKAIIKGCDTFFNKFNL